MVIFSFQFCRQGRYRLAQIQTGVLRWGKVCRRWQWLTPVPPPLQPPQGPLLYSMHRGQMASFISQVYIYTFRLHRGHYCTVCTGARWPVLYPRYIYTLSVSTGATIVQYAQGPDWQSKIMMVVGPGFVDTDIKYLQIWKHCKKRGT